jgi:hypothetical protein
MACIMPQAAILTGDLIASTSAPAGDVDRLMQWLATALQDAQRGLDLSPTRFTRFRGDGWQAIIQPAPLYLRTVTHLLSGLRLFDIGLDTRIGIGIGDVDRPGTRDLSDATGPAFTASGHALDTLPRTDRLAITGLTGPHLAWHRAALETLAHFSARWSREQAEAIHRRVLMDKAPLHQIASNLGISRQALSSRLTAAGEKPLMALIRAAEAAP